MLGGIGPMELSIIFLIVLLVFGGKKIPEIAKGLGKGIRDFKAAQKEPDKLEEETSEKKGSSAVIEEKKQQS